MLVRSFLEQRIRRFIPIRTIIYSAFWLIPVVELAVRPNGVLIAATVGLIIGLLHLLADSISKWADVNCPSCGKSVAALATYAGLRGLQDLEYCPKCGLSFECHVEDIGTGGDLPETVDRGLPTLAAGICRGLWLVGLVGLACFWLTLWAGFPPAIGFAGWFLIFLSLSLGIGVQASGVFGCPECRQNLGWLLSGSLTRTLKATARYCPFCRCNLAGSHSHTPCESNHASAETET